MRLVIPILILLFLALLFLLWPVKNNTTETNLIPLLGPDLKPIAYGTPTKEFNGYVMVGKWRGLPVYAPRNTVFVPKFVDKLSLVAGKPLPPSIPVDWWLEVNDNKIKPLGLASTLFNIHVVTPYEDFTTKESVIGVYSGWHVGKIVDNNSCVYVKKFRDVTVPVLLRRRGIVDPDAEKICYECNNNVVLHVFANNKPAKGYYTVINKFFGRFDGEIRLCRCDRVRIYVDGYKPWSGNVCEDKNINLRPLEHCKHLEGNYIYIDSVGAFFVGPMCVEEGVYRAFERFPLREINKDVPIIKVKGYVGKKYITEAPLYTLLFNKGYSYVLERGAVPVEGFLCYKNVCLPVGGDVLLLDWGAPLTVERNVFIAKSTP